MFSIFLACVWIFFGELYGNFVGWGSIVTQFFLQNILHFDIKHAIALDNAAVIGSELWVFLMLLKHHKIKNWMIGFLFVASIWATFGATLLYYIPESYIKILFTVSLFLVLLKNFSQNKKNVWKKHFIPTLKNICWLYFAWIILSVYNALMSIGDFTFALLTFMFIFYFSYQESLFLITFWFIFARGVATISYLHYGLIPIDYFIPMFFTATISWLIGWYFVQKVHTDILEKVLKVFWVCIWLYLALNILWII